MRFPDSARAAQLAGSVAPATDRVAARLQQGLAVVKPTTHRAQPASVWSYRSPLSVMSAYSVASLLSFASVLSIGSAGSILSVGSSGSILSIGSAGSILSIGSAGTILGIGRASVARHRERDEKTGST